MSSRTFQYAKSTDPDVIAAVQRNADIDVYGNGSTAVWSLVLEHGGEDCTCIDCIDNEEN